MDMPNTSISLDDKFNIKKSNVLLNGTQALVRLMLGQKQRDERQGLNTAGFVTGYSCLLYTSPSPRDRTRSRMPSSA